MLQELTLEIEERMNFTNIAIVIASFLGLRWLYTNSTQVELFEIAAIAAMVLVVCLTIVVYKFFQVKQEEAEQAIIAAHHHVEEATESYERIQAQLHELEKEHGRLVGEVEELRPLIGVKERYENALLRLSAAEKEAKEASETVNVLRKQVEDMRNLPDLIEDRDRLRRSFAQKKTEELRAELEEKEMHINKLIDA